MTYFPPAVSLALAASMPLPASACGPYAPIIPTPEFFGLSERHRPMSYYEREENLELWRAVTSERIPLADIEEAVYEDSRDEFFSRSVSVSGREDNLFYVYIGNTDDDEIICFLDLAKKLEELWKERRSPWYYPRDRYACGDDDGDFREIVWECKAYDGKRLRDRYALQATRALFASRRYADCIEYADSAFAGIPDGNLMKRMARRYVAGCWSRLGETGIADSLFAATGDIWSVTRKNPVEFVSRINPGAPQLMEYIRENAADTAFMRDVMPVARRLLADRRVRHKGDWNFLLAYVANEFVHDASLARRHIRSAVRQSFSTAELKDLARTYRMKLDGASGNQGMLLSDLRWLEGKTGPVDRDAREWIRRGRNIIYADWVPRLWEKGDYGMAILLSAYADNFGLLSQTPDRGSVDYGSLSFQMMGSLSSTQLASAYGRIMARSPLSDYLRRKTCIGRDCINELIGTLALREENYARAERYLSRVDRRYLESMNINRGGYLSGDPFRAYPSRWKLHVPFGDEEAPFEVERYSLPRDRRQNARAKLDFARRMRSYKNKMRNGSTPDERGMARLMYAIGRRNSFEECWALTQYWRGDYIGLFVPSLQYYDGTFPDDHYGFLYDYESTTGHKATEELYKREVEASLAMLTTDEAKARANYILGNLAKVVRNYGRTSTAEHVRTSCDNWKSWLCSFSGDALFSTCRCISRAFYLTLRKI